MNKIETFSIPMRGDFAIIIAAALAKWDGKFEDGAEVDEFAVDIVTTFAQLLMNFAGNSIAGHVAEMGIKDIEAFLEENS